MACKSLKGNPPYLYTSFLNQNHPCVISTVVASTLIFAVLSRPIRPLNNSASSRILIPLLVGVVCLRWEVLLRQWQPPKPLAQSPLYNSQLSYLQGKDVHTALQLQSASFPAFTLSPCVKPNPSPLFQRQPGPPLAKASPFPDRDNTERGSNSAPVLWLSFPLTEKERGKFQGLVLFTSYLLISQVADLRHY